MNEKFDWMIIPVMLLAALTGGLLTYQVMEKAWEMEAVRKGHAIWETGDSGAAYFKWKENSK